MDGGGSDGPNGLPGIMMTGAVPMQMARREAIIDRALHLVAIAAAAIGSAFLLRSLSEAGRPELKIPVGLYILGLLAMLICSAAYNGSRNPRLKPVLRRLDYAAIFLAIAGTYSPFLAGVPGDRTLGMAYAGIWILAAAGVLAQLLFHGRMRKPLSIALYLALGWSVVAVIGPVSASLPADVLSLIALGGILYTVGVVFHLAQRLPYQNAIWHAFVIAAAGIRFLAVIAFVRS